MKLAEKQKKTAQCREKKLATKAGIAAANPLLVFSLYDYSKLTDIEISTNAPVSDRL